ncbi:hypothetical protein ACIRP2_35405 [Streptomyces sp. NPDC101194]|uniref:hypothetical protein n=1 Tax=Streptomyces sp. NPDC101194 TaxID=3366127 RepID=UPI0037F9550A
MTADQRATEWTAASDRATRLTNRRVMTAWDAMRIHAILAVGLYVLAIRDAVPADRVTLDSLGRLLADPDHLHDTVAEQANDPADPAAEKWAWLNAPLRMCSHVPEPPTPRTSLDACLDEARLRVERALGP